MVQLSKVDGGYVSSITLMKNCERTLNRSLYFSQQCLKVCFVCMFLECPCTSFRGIILTVTGQWLFLAILKELFGRAVCRPLSVDLCWMFLNKAAEPSNVLHSSQMSLCETAAFHTRHIPRLHETCFPRSLIQDILVQHTA